MRPPSPSQPRTPGPTACACARWTRASPRTPARAPPTSPTRSGPSPSPPARTPGSSTSWTPPPGPSSPSRSRAPAWTSSRTGSSSWIATRPAAGRRRRRRWWSPRRSRRCRRSTPRRTRRRSGGWRWRWTGSRGCSVTGTTWTGPGRGTRGPWSTSATRSAATDAPDPGVFATGITRGWIPRPVQRCVCRRRSACTCVRCSGTGATGWTCITACRDAS
mmetsp:Transcript_71527/g.190761  ORF Transcript_71527/g.190761 Transcript_71527/m.190761 type:complete len:218 (+) Transcript_71527:3457-4110(+)